MESASLTYEQRLLAIQQLGRDYMAAGLYDRAEDMFNQLTDETDFRIGALQQLLQIYQATSEWQKAIDVAERLVKLGKDKQRVEIAHFYCELALQHMASDDLNRAMTLLKKGAAADKNSARVSIMMGRVFMAKGEYAKAVESLQRVISRTENWSAKRWKCCKPAISSWVKLPNGQNSCNARWKRTPVPMLN